MARVLVVDDDPDIRVAIAEALKIAGYDVGSAATGAGALALCRQQCPDLVLLDQMLPDLDGLEVCRRLRDEPSTSRVPIVFLTARTNEQDRVRGLAAGADDYVIKPFSTAELLLRIRAVLRRSTPVELSLPPLWVRLRDQYRVWNGYAELHLARGEWRDCLEVSRSILDNCEPALTSAERTQLYERLSLCAQHLGDDEAYRSWRELARSA
ncbi:MAG TPA: response regulator [Polyangia bacterium]|jgi:DNA-binding response OmpR family regulator